MADANLRDLKLDPLFHVPNVFQPQNDHPASSTMLLQARQLHRLAQVASRIPNNVIFCAHLRPARPLNSTFRRNLASAKKAAPSARQALAKQSLQRPLLTTEPKQPTIPAAKPFSPAQTPIASIPGGGKGVYTSGVQGSRIEI